MAAIKVTFVEVDGTVKTIEHDKPGRSLMEVGRDNGVVGILGDCGGGCCCATCHVYVDPQWQGLTGKADDIEAAMIDMASNVRSNSRLSCQIKLRPDLDGLRVTVAPEG